MYIKVYIYILVGLICYREITRKRAQEVFKILEELKDTEFKDRRKDYPYSEWERKRAIVRERLKKLPAYIRQAVENIIREEQVTGRPHALDLEKKVHLFLLARLMRKSNRGMEEALELFQPLFGFNVSYKYIERLYSDDEVKLALHNLFILLLQEEGTTGKYSGDGSGYSLTIESHYRTNPLKKGKKYLYFFTLIDLGTGMYVGYGISHHSEMDAFHKARKMLEKNNVKLDSIRLDKYYSSRKVLRIFSRQVSVYVLPKKNLKNIGISWYQTVKRMIEDPAGYLTEYYLRNTSESGHSSDKRRFGSLINQRREDRQDTAMFSIAVLHNLYAFKTQPH